jgi:hypothetical protein
VTASKNIQRLLTFIEVSFKELTARKALLYDARQHRRRERILGEQQYGGPGDTQSNVSDRIHWVPRQA